LVLVEFDHCWEDFFEACRQCFKIEGFFCASYLGDDVTIEEYPSEDNSGFVFGFCYAKAQVIGVYAHECSDKFFAGCGVNGDGFIYQCGDLGGEFSLRYRHLFQLQY